MRQFFLAMLMLCMALMPLHDAFAKSKRKAAPQPNYKYAGIVMDAATGAVLYDSDSNKPLHPASLTKVMTLLLLFESLENGTVRLNDRLMVSQHAANQQPSKLGLNPGSSIRVEDAILAVVTKSANDMAVAIAENLAGSESSFAARMNRRAHDIGMVHTNFVNASGLHDSRQVSSAHDMAVLARYILVRYPNYYRYFGTKQFTYRGKTMTNHNRLMQTYPGMDGFKTGFVNQSGFNLIASAKHGDKRLIGVVFGGKSTKSRNDQMANLLNNGFAQMANPRYASGVTIQTRIASATALPAPQKPKINISQLSTEEGVTEKAVENVETAMNRGDYSEITGEGDYDASTARRVEAGLLAAAVYKGEHDKVQALQVASTQNALANPRSQQLNTDFSPTSYTPSESPTPASDLWSIQIGAYTSRIATDDALRIARQKLPLNLSGIASPIVAPLNSGEGTLFRARLGGFNQSQAVQACRYFHDCLPIAPH